MAWCSERVASGVVKSDLMPISVIKVYNSNLIFFKFVHRPNSIELKVTMNYRNGRYIIVM